MTTTLADLRLAARQRADMVNSKFVDDTTELTQWVNESYRELYDLLVGRYADYYVQLSDTFTITDNTYPLPADHYKLLGVDVSCGGEWHELKPFMFNERNIRTNGVRALALGVIERLRYRILGGNLHITPADIAPGDYRIWYVPNVSRLTANGDAIDSEAERWAEYIAVDCAIKCLAKEESDVSVLVMQKQALEKRIKEMATNRDAGSPQRISDVRGGGHRWYR